MKRRKLAELCVALLLAMCLCACGESTSLGERAIVKTVYLSRHGEQYEAALAVFTCEPNSDTASVQGKAKIYSAHGDSLDEAISNAEKKQNKKPFYAQNEILLLGPGAVEQDITPYLVYFGQENAARPNLSVFVTAMTGEELEECGETITDAVGEGARLVEETAQGQGAARGLYELSVEDGKKVSGWLPVLEFGPEPDGFIGVRELAVIQEGQAVDRLSDLDMELALVLSGKKDQIQYSGQVQGRPFSFSTEKLRLIHDVSRGEQGPVLTIRIEGELRAIAQGGSALKGEPAASAAQQANWLLEETALRIDARTFLRGNDLFGHEWWFRLEDAGELETMKQTHGFFSSGRVAYQSRIRPAME